MAESNLYEGVYYCVRCGVGSHITCIVARNASCDNCGGTGFISSVDFDINKILKEYGDGIRE